MVQLKEAELSFEGQRFRFDFNTTMVQLKEAEGGEWLGGLNLFQYHYGSIKSLLPSRESVACQNFNTTMDQLKALFRFLLASLPLGNFNTTMVQLKGEFILREYPDDLPTISIPLWFN